MGFFKKFRWRYVLMFMAVIGPGIITANADNDGTGIVGYTLVGAKYGLNMLFALVVVTVILAVTQELGARIGVATGKGLGGVIREKFGLKLTMIALIAISTVIVESFRRRKCARGCDAA